MKFKITLLAVFVLTIVFFAACNKNNGQQSYYMNAWFGSTTEYSAANCMARPYGNAMLIQGLATSSYIPVAPYISITIANWNTATDSFNFDSTMHNNYAQYFSSATQYELSATGFVLIKSANNQAITGIFRFTCTDSTRIDSGTFVAQLIQ